MGSVLSAGASLLGAKIGADASGRAADKQYAATQDATAEQRRQYDQTRQDMMPFYNTGVAGNQQLAYLLGLNQAPEAYSNVNKEVGAFGGLSKSFDPNNFQQDPGYQFRLNEGLKALQRSAAAKGMANSGATMKAINDYAQGAASQEFNNAYNRYNTDQTNLYNRLAGVSNAGQVSANTLANVGQNTANQISSNMIQGGNAQAAGTMGTANAWSTGLNNAAKSIGNSFNPFSFMEMGG